MMSGKAQNKTILSTAGEFINPVLEIVFESVKQKHPDNTIFDQQVVNFIG